MEKESFFTDNRWHLLAQLSKGPSSPTQLAQTLNTTIANISQQLKLLEAIGLVKKERVRNRDKGKPRMLFSLSQDTALLAPTAKNFAHRTLIPLSSHQKHILKIWLSPNPSIHHSLERLWWKLEDHLDSILLIELDPVNSKVYTTSSLSSLSKISVQGIEHILLLPNSSKKSESLYLIYSKENS
ncbi:MAG TPA: MarR family transcriptional regulator [Candidatus Nanoarchaeia archaeon]|nr:MarR family transcriptional regulator [Candidatus Nanoarchaeia archaeon]